MTFLVNAALVIIFFFVVCFILSYLDRHGLPPFRKRTGCTVNPVYTKLPPGANVTDMLRTKRHSLVWEKNSKEAVLKRYLSEVAHKREEIDDLQKVIDEIDAALTPIMPKK